MFRQVIAHRWAPGTTDDDRRRFRAALDGLRAVPELSALRHGDDAGHFPGNHDYVAVLDFPDVAAARRYVDASRTAVSSTGTPAGSSTPGWSCSTTGPTGRRAACTT